MILETKNYKIKYDKEKTFTYPDIKIEEGSCVSLMGSSGCGKTTLLNSLFSIDFHGEVNYHIARLFNKDIKLWTEDKYQVLSYMPQYAQDGLNPLLTIEKQIELVMKNNKNNIGSVNVKKYMEELELKEDILKLYSSELSGGMKQRIAILLGFIKAPRLFVFDEPSSALDYYTMFKIVGFLKKRKEEGTSLLIVSHDEVFVESLSDVIYKL
jgi:ABC-type dipeptide/oligopeptide/nickel transport system ATPase subunit